MVETFLVAGASCGSEIDHCQFGLAGLSITELLVPSLLCFVTSALIVQEQLLHFPPNPCLHCLQPLGVASRLPV